MSASDQISVTRFPRTTAQFIKPPTLCFSLGMQDSTPVRGASYEPPALF
jgi:hypothetical protein